MRRWYTWSTMRRIYAMMFGLLVPPFGLFLFFYATENVEVN